jgi:hypothetical protein
VRKFTVRNHSTRKNYLHPPKADRFNCAQTNSRMNSFTEAREAPVRFGVNTASKVYHCPGTRWSARPSKAASCPRRRPKRRVPGRITETPAPLKDQVSCSPLYSPRRHLYVIIRR